MVYIYNQIGFKSGVAIICLSNKTYSIRSSLIGYLMGWRKLPTLYVGLLERGKRACLATHGHCDGMTVK